MDYIDSYVNNETPTGAVDGVNITFTTKFNILDIEDFDVNDVPYNDLWWSGKTITLLLPPQPGDKIRVSYFRANQQ